MVGRRAVAVFGSLIVAALAPLLPAPSTSAAGAPSSAPAARRVVVESTLNVYNGNPTSSIRADVTAALRASQLVRLQEVYPRTREAVRSAVRAAGGWSLTFAGDELGIAWDRRAWERVAPARQLAMPGTQRRTLQWVVLRHRESGRVVRVANMHADARCTALSRAYLERVELWTWRRRQLGAWPILLGGDSNCPSWQSRAYRRDRVGSVDRLLTTRGARIDELRRWAVPARSDHRLHLRRLRL